MGLLLAVASPAYERVLPGLELKAGARDLANALRAGRARAIEEAREVAIVFDVTAGVYRIDRDQAGRALPSGARVSLTTAQSEILDEGVGRIRFFPDGASTGGQITLERDGATYHVQVEWLGGHVSIDR